MYFCTFSEVLVLAEALMPHLVPQAVVIYFYKDSSFLKRILVPILNTIYDSERLIELNCQPLQK